MFDLHDGPVRSGEDPLQLQTFRSTRFTLSDVPLPEPLQYPRSKQVEGRGTKASAYRCEHQRFRVRETHAEGEQPGDQEFERGHEQDRQYLQRVLHGLHLGPVREVARVAEAGYDVRLCRHLFVDSADPEPRSNAESLS